MDSITTGKASKSLDASSPDDIETDLTELFQLVLDTIPTRVFWKSTDQVFLGANSVFAADAGVETVDELIGKTDYDFCWPREQAEAFRRDDAEVLLSGKPKLGIEEPQDHIDGKTHWLETNKIPLKDSKGQVIGLLGTYTDVTERKEHQLEIEYQAMHDPLTGLPNRRALKAAIAVLEQDTPRAAWSALLFVDLDQFKGVNDSLGHAVGDKLLQAVAQRLIASGRTDNSVYRLGGDEFSILIPAAGASESLAADEAVTCARELITALGKPFDVDTYHLYIGACVGITLVDPEQSKLRVKFGEADLAMYMAKAVGHNQFKLYDQNMQVVVNRRHAIQNKLRERPASRRDFHLVYQPQLSVTGEMICAEALLRWHDDELGNVPPDEFIAIAEETGAIHDIGLWVLDEVAQQLLRWQSEGGKFAGLRVAVNLSPQQFQDPDIAANLQSVVAQYGISPTLIDLEITESLPLIENDELRAALKALSDVGFNIVIDDFGSGYSSLTYLTMLPFKKIKLDRQFVNRLDGDEKHAAVAGAVVRLATSLGAEVVAEGIEDKAEFARWAHLGCQVFQGFHFSPGVLPDQLELTYPRESDPV